MPRFLKGWFTVRRELSHGRRLLLAALSFLLPLGLWCGVSYIPWLWHPDVKLQIAPGTGRISAVFTAGNRLSREFFPVYVNAIRQDNAEIRASRETGVEAPGTQRANRVLLRQIAPLAAKNGWLPAGAEQDDAAIYHIWRDLAMGAEVSCDPVFSDENLAIIRENWATLAALSPDFDARLLPRVPLLKLVPQGVPSNPIYLPPPHEVIEAGWRDFTVKSEGGAPTMGERYRHSLRVVFLGFFWACVIGVPLGILCGVFDFFSKLIEPFVDFFRYMPAPAFSTLLVAVLSVHDAPKITLILIGTVFQMILIVAKTTRLLDPAMLEAAQTLGAKPKQLVMKVVLPGILPNLYNDLRILLGWAWTWLVIAELIGVKSGLTGFIDTQGTFRNFDRVYPVIILIGVTGFLTDQILAWLHGMIFPWSGNPGGFSRAVASAVTWPVRTIAASARRTTQPGPP